MIYFTSDPHFGHSNVIKYCERPFKDVEEMNRKLIENYNSVIQSGDDVYCLGDFSFGNPLQYRKRLNGNWFLIRGNHDFKQTVEGCFGWVKDVYMLKTKGVMIFMSHYAHRVWPQCHHGALHVYGHSHDSIDGFGRSGDVGVDAHNYMPVSIDEIIRVLGKKELTKHH